MTLPWVGDSDLLWDVLILGGEVWPGLPDVTSTTSRAIDAQKKAGDDGGALVDQGYEPAKVKITIRVWLREQWEELQRLLATVHPRRKGGVRTPLDIWHPETLLKGVRQVYITTIGEASPGRGADHGMLTITLEAIEWFAAPKKAKSKAQTNGGPLDPLPLPPGVSAAQEFAF